MTTRPTTPTATATGCPRPCWTVLRDTAPYILDDLTDAWARIESLTLITNDGDGHLSELRWTIEHLGTLIEDHLANCTADADYCNGIGLDPEPGPVFQPGDWHTPARGRWEVAAGLDGLDDSCTDRPAFEATIEHTTGNPTWLWTLYRANGDHLEALDHGRAPTLDHAQHKADTLARRWRDTPAEMERARRLRPVRYTTTVTCDSCTTSCTVEALTVTDRCPTSGCASKTFDGFTLDELADAAYRNG